MTYLNLHTLIISLRVEVVFLDKYTYQAEMLWMTGTCSGRYTWAFYLELCVSFTEFGLETGDSKGGCPDVPEFVRQPPIYLPTLRQIPMEVTTALVLTLTLSSEGDPRIEGYRICSGDIGADV